MYVFITIIIVNACIAGTIPATPENITVTFLTPTTVRVSWQTLIDLNSHPVEKYIVTYKPTNDRVVQDVAGNSEAIILDRLSPSTQYSIAVTAVWLGKKYRSRPIFFKTLDMPTPSSQQDFSGRPVGSGPGLGLGLGLGYGNNVAVGGVGVPGGGFGGSAVGNFGSNRAATNGSLVYGEDVTSTTTNISQGTRRELPTIRGVEIGIVLIVLMVWAGAIALFFNRWGKIRMLLPYQPDYKHEQLKVPGTGVCTGGVCNGQHSHQNLHPDMFIKFDSSECGALAYQPLHCNSRHFHMLQEEPSISISERCTRSRINSAIFVSSEGRGFDSIEFLRRHGSQSVLCRKARSAENITDNERKKSFSEKRQWRTDEEGSTDGRGEGSEYGGIEMKETRTTVPGTSALGHLITAAVTTSNMVVGSISIEAPPAYMTDDSISSSSAAVATASQAQPGAGAGTAAGAIETSAADSLPCQLKQQQQALQSTQSTLSSFNSASHDSTDTVEELVVIPRESRSRVLVHQRTSLNRSQSPAKPGQPSPHSSPKATGLSLKCKPKINALPMVSVSGPSPTQEKPPPTERL